MRQAEDNFKFQFEILKREIDSKETVLQSWEQNLEFKRKNDITQKVEKEKLISDL